MRVLIVLIAVLLSAGITAAQAPSAEPVGNLAQVMRGILFPNSNIIFDAQTQDPGAPPEPAAGGNTVTSTFAGIYTGWQVVENSAIALAEAAKLIMIPGRLCENGRPVPNDRADWAEYALGLEEAGKAALEAARAKDLDAVIEVTNLVAGACENCHIVYRDKPGGAPRCVP